MASASTLNHYSNHSSSVSPTTIQLDEERKARLARLKVGNMTYDDVIGHLLMGIDEEEFRRRVLRWEAEFAKRVRGNPRNKRLL